MNKLTFRMSELGKRENIMDKTELKSKIITILEENNLTILDNKDYWIRGIIEDDFENIASEIVELVYCGKVATDNG